MDLALNNQQRLICHTNQQTQPNQINCIIFISKELNDTPLETKLNIETIYVCFFFLFFWYYAISETSFRDWTFTREIACSDK